jgi:hypothetical protein
MAMAHNEDMNTTTRPNVNLRNAGGNWILGTVDGMAVQAKAYDEPSQFGMDEEPRISKLWIQAAGKVLYSYDRGYDFDGIMPESLAMVVESVAKAIK